MPLDSIYIARHGYRANWLPPPHAPSPTGIDSDPPLATHGVDQAGQLAAFLRSLPRDQQPQLVLLSPFYRCVETAQPVAKLLQIPIALERGVGEWYKKNRSVIPEPANYSDLARFFPEVLVPQEKWPRDTALNVIPDLTGETEQDILERARLVCARLEPAVAERFPDVRRILIVTHAATKIALGLALLGLENVRSQLPNGEYLRAGACALSHYSASPKWSLVYNGRCDFLSQGEEMNWTFNSTYEAGSDEDIKERQQKAAAAAATGLAPGSSGSATDASLAASSDSHASTASDAPDDTEYEVRK